MQQGLEQFPQRGVPAQRHFTVHRLQDAGDLALFVE
jgi:hypothetical protein